ncbi:MAG: hypothetical protein HKN80_07590 [Acidimicrobiia bacterium]|nr:hypothetical protein [Acidimicrobiia bacterium]
MTDIPRTKSHKPNRWKRVALLVGVGWMIFLGYLLLTGDPPDFWFEDIGSVDGPGHVAAGLVTGLVAYLLFLGRAHAGPLALAATVALLLGLELGQDAFTDRGYESSDVWFSLLGAVAGVGAGRVGRWVAGRLQAE